jgi:large repetitive protein
VTIRDAGGAAIGTATVMPGGTYTATLTTPQTNGQLLTAVQADLAGNASPSVNATAPDTTAPTAPSATVDASGALVTGTGEAGATITVRDALGTPIGTAVVAADGSYTATLSAPQLNGQLLQVTQNDPAGNVSPPTPATAPDITAPLAPAGTVSADGLAVTGTGEPGATVTVRDATGTPIGTALVAGNGSFTAPLTTAQINGQLLTLSQADPAGNLSPNASATAPDLTAPGAPSATVSGDGAVVTGTGEPGATVTVRDPVGTVIGTALVAANGGYAVALTTPQANGQTLQVSQADPTGNASPATPALAPDFTAPAAPSAAVNANGTAVTGTGEPGATVHVINAAGTEIGTALVAGDGSYTATLTTPQANGETLSITQSDPAGNPSPAAVATAPDITPPAPPTGVAINGEGTVVTGTGEAGATVEVRDAGGTLLGSATVAANGSFAVSLNDPQTAGEALAVTLRDPAGNLSGAAPLIAPFDIDAFDNTASASLNLVPVTTNENLGTANYLALVSLGLLNTDLQVLATPNVQFTVAPGHTLDATFTYDALLGIGVLSGYSVVVQRFDGTNWVAVSGTGTSTLLQLSLLNGDLVASEALGPGQYRAFVTFEGAAGVGLLGGLNVSGVNSDYTDVAAVQPGAATGNVIADAGPGGAIDIVSPQTVVQSVTVGGVTTAVVAGGTSVHGAWGTLVLNPDGSYTYTPDANAAAIGHVDSFTYTLVDPSDGELESATLTVTIGSPDITGAPVAVNDTGVATATFAHDVTTIPAAIDSSFATPTALVLNGPQTGTVHDSFTVGPNATADVTLSAIQSSGLSVLPTYTITVTNSAGTVVGTITQASIANLGLGTGVSLVLHDLPSGTYNYTVSSTNVLGTGYGTNVYVGETVTHLDQYHLTGSTPVSGELLANDTAGTAFAAVRVQSGGSFVEVGDTPITITGAHGTLTVDETGHYTYQPSASLTYSGTDTIDSFTYQLVQPNGTVATAHLDIAVDINNGAAPALAEAVPLAMFSAVAGPEVLAADHAPISFGLIDGQDSVETLLGQFLHDRQEALGSGAADTASVEAPAPEIAAAPVADDPLQYLVTPSDIEDRHQLTHVV